MVDSVIQGGPDIETDDGEEISASEIVQILQSYITEAEQSREGGTSHRDDVWDHNWDVYWGRLAFSGKADWQATEIMPEAQQFVDRWSASIRQALIQPGTTYNVDIPGDEERNLEQPVRKYMDYLLKRCGKNSSRQLVAFPAVFEATMKTAAISAGSLSVTWKDDEKPGRVAVENVDPREVWMDATGRGLYRIRRSEIDRNQLEEMAGQKDSDGNDLFNDNEIELLRAQVNTEYEQNRESASGQTLSPKSSGRVSITIHEFLAVLLDATGKQIKEESLVVMANEQFIIRGPEPNPFWHKNDWLVYAPLIPIPFSVYGRSYMEVWSGVYIAFNDMTNLILDGTFTSVLNAFAAVPELLEDPTEIQEGFHPNKIFQVAQGNDPKDFMKEIPLGSLPPEALSVWNGLKNELQEGANLNEIGLGQLADKSGTTATEINRTTQSSSSVIRSVARTIEENLLNPTFNLMFQTGLQHEDFTNKEVIQVLGEDVAKMMGAQKKEFKDIGVTFDVTGISSAVARGQETRNLLGAMQTIGQNPEMTEAFKRKYSVEALTEEILRLFGVDTTKLTETPRMAAVREILETIERANAAATPNTNGASQPAPQSIVPQGEIG